MRVVIAPDSFKGTIDSPAAAAALADGWKSVRPGDDLIQIPLADGGEGTVRALSRSARNAAWCRTEVTGPDGRPVKVEWLLLPDGTAVLELASASGLPLMAEPDPAGATSRGLGELLVTATDGGAHGVILGLGGSATTDGGAGALSALGARLLDGDGAEVRPGGGSLVQLQRIDLTGLRKPPAGGVRCLTDVTAPLLGPGGAAAVFGPQKGADAADVALLERGLTRLAQLLGGDPSAAGAGAAGGTGYGLATVWGADLVPGAPAVAAAAGLAAAV